MKRPKWLDFHGEAFWAALMLALILVAAIAMYMLQGCTVNLTNTIPGEEEDENKPVVTQPTP